MGQVINVLAGLATTFVGYIIGRTWQRVIDRMPYRRARIFWQPLLNSHTQIVVSRFEPEDFTEPTGVVGGGDAIALREISSYFSRIGLRRPDVLYVEEPTLDGNNNLILLGGPGSNAVTKYALRRINAQVELFDPGPGKPTEVHDLKTGIIHKPETPGCDYDYGIIIRTHNPLNSSRGLVIFAGTYGYGTWAGVKLALAIGTDKFLEKCREVEAEYAQAHPAGFRHLIKAFYKRLSRSGSRSADNGLMPLECIFRVDVYASQPYEAEIIECRPIQPDPQN